MRLKLEEIFVKMMALPNTGSEINELAHITEVAINANAINRMSGLSHCSLYPMRKLGANYR